MPPPTYSANGAAIANLDQLVFNKGYAYGSIQNNTNDAIPFGALQNIGLNHNFGFSELIGPESLSPVGVGVKSEELTGTWDYGVIDTEQFIMFMGGTQAYNAGANKTTFTKLVDQEPQPFDFHLKSALASPDLEIFLYRCLSPSFSLKAGNREFVTGSGNFRCYGQDAAAGGLLFQVVKPGNRANTS